jgi:hypothetical protein
MEAIPAPPAGAASHDLIEHLGRFLILNVAGVEHRLDLKEMLSVNPDRAEEQLVMQPTLSAYFGQVVESLRDSTARAEQNREAHEAILFESFRESMMGATKDGAPKPASEAAIKAAVRKDPGYQQRVAEEQTYSSVLKRAEHTFWAIKERKDILLAILARRAAERAQSSPGYTGPRF